MVLDQGQDRRCTPVGDPLDVEPKVAIPGTGRGIWLLLARAEGHTDPPLTGTSGDVRDLQGVANTGPCHCVRVPRVASLSVTIAHFV